MRHAKAIFMLAAVLSVCDSLGAANVIAIEDAFAQSGAQSTPVRILADADANDDGTLNIADAIYSLAYQFAKAKEPPPPFAGCGPDPTLDQLTCNAFAPCQ